MHDIEEALLGFALTRCGATAEMEAAGITFLSAEHRDVWAAVRAAAPDCSWARVAQLRPELIEILWVIVERAPISLDLKPFMEEWRVQRLVYVLAEVLRTTLHGLEARQPWEDLQPILAGAAKTLEGCR